MHNTFAFKMNSKLMFKAMTTIADATKITKLFEHTFIIIYMEFYDCLTLQEKNSHKMHLLDLSTKNIRIRLKYYIVIDVRPNQ